MRSSTVDSPSLLRVALLVSLTILALTAAASGDDWSLDMQQDGIDVYTRPVEGSGIKQFKGVGRVGATAEEILALLRDSNRFKTWFPNTSESKLLDRDGSVSYQYSVMATPWPMDDRDNVLRSVMSRNEKSGVIEIEVNAAPDYYPMQSGRVRVQKASGHWRLEPVGEGETHVTFVMHLEPGGGIPQWLINARIVATPFEALTNLRTTLGKRSGSRD